MPPLVFSYVDGLLASSVGDSDGLAAGVLAAGELAGELVESAGGDAAGLVLLESDEQPARKAVVATAATESETSIDRGDMRRTLGPLQVVRGPKGSDRGRPSMAT